MSRKNNWDWWKVLDAWVVVLSVVILTTSLGVLLNGSMPGVVSQHLGFVHPGDSEPRFSLEILLVLISLVIFGIVSRVRKNFRFYSWYKGDASVAKDGLAGLLWGVLVCVGVAIGSFGAVTPYIGFVPRLFVMGIIGAIILSSVIYWRSGKNRGERMLDYFKKRKESR